MNLKIFKRLQIKNVSTTQEKLRFAQTLNPLALPNTIYSSARARTSLTSHI
jgi:hypothetical protein